MKRLPAILGALVLIVFLFSCQTAPEEAPDEEAAGEAQAEEERAAQPPDEERDRAEEMRDFIAQYELGQFAEEEFETGENAFTSAQDVYGEDNELAAELFVEAGDSYARVINTGIQELQSNWESEIEDLDAEAQELKAPRAMQSEYEAARSTLEDAREAFDAEDYDAAAGYYQDSLEQHEDVVRQTRRKRERAVQALENIDSDMRDTEGDIDDLQREQEDFEPEDEEDDEEDEEEGQS
ncbi:MAG: hypothetical protein ACQETQ_05680 [Spirochaetota bacterium]